MARMLGEKKRSCLNHAHYAFNGCMLVATLEIPDTSLTPIVLGDFVAPPVLDQLQGHAVATREGLVRHQEATRHCQRWGKP